MIKKLVLCFIFAFSVLNSYSEEVVFTDIRIDDGGKRSEVPVDVDVDDNSMTIFIREDIDWLLPHQANVRIIHGVGQKLNLPEEKVIVNLQNHGNTSAASIPLALSECMESGQIKKGDLVVLTAMGAGFTWGGALVRI